jgi:hypothetical protein
MAPPPDPQRRSRRRTRVVEPEPEPEPHVDREQQLTFCEEHWDYLDDDQQVEIQRLFDGLGRGRGSTHVDYLVEVWPFMDGWMQDDIVAAFHILLAD